MPRQRLRSIPRESATQRLGIRWCCRHRRPCIHIALASAARAACNIAIIRAMPMRRWGLNPVVKRRPGRGINGDQGRGAYIFTASIVVLILAFLVNWWRA